MISLLTGTPGSGKTCWLVNHLLTDPTVSQRPLYVHGIPYLRLAHEPIYCHSPVCEPCGKIPETKKANMLCAEDWHSWAPDGALIVLDEVQNVWRPRSSASKLPDSVAKLETHRHRGLDFWMISQGPHLFDSNVRRLIGRHIHLRATSLGRYEFEWPECKDNVQSTSDAVRRAYRLPKRAFDMYQSASLHTKQSHRLPMGVYVLVGAVALVAVMGGRIYSRMSDHMDMPSDDIGSGGAGAAPAAPAPVAPGDVAMRFAHVEAPKRSKFEPEEPGRPETAEAYARLLVVRDYPFPSACIRDLKEDECSCYTNQGTPYDMPKMICYEYAAGRVFNPYKARKKAPVFNAAPGQQQIHSPADVGPQGVPLYAPAPGSRNPAPFVPTEAPSQASLP